jgi:hypothetical protein
VALQLTIHLTFCYFLRFECCLSKFACENTNPVYIPVIQKQSSQRIQHVDIELLFVVVISWAFARLAGVLVVQ